MSGLSQIYDAINAEVQEDNTWSCKLMFECGKDGSGAVTNSNLVDLVTYLNPNPSEESFLQKHYRYPPSTRFRFPICYTGWGAKTDLVTDITNAALNSGNFKLHTRSTNTPGSRKSLESTVRVANILLGCCRNAVYRPENAAREFVGGGAVAGLVPESIHHRPESTLFL